jgi:hypothetical protein
VRELGGRHLPRQPCDNKISSFLIVWMSSRVLLGIQIVDLNRLMDTSVASLTSQSVSSTFGATNPLPYADLRRQRSSGESGSVSLLEAQDFFAAFGNDGVGTIGTPTTINSGDMAGILMVAVQALEKRTAELKEKEAEIRELKEKVAQLDGLRTETAELRAKQAHFETIAARLEALELKLNFPVQVRASTFSGEDAAEMKR